MAPTDRRKSAGAERPTARRRRKDELHHKPAVCDQQQPASPNFLCTGGWRRFSASGCMRHGASTLRRRVAPHHGGSNCGVLSIF